MPFIPSPPMASGSITNSEDASELLLTSPGVEVLLRDLQYSSREVEPNTGPERRTILLNDSNNWSVEVGRASSTLRTVDSAPMATNARFGSKVVSKVHATISAEPERKKVYITDEGSMHGTYLNGKRLPEQVDHSVENGDVIKLGAPVDREGRKIALSSVTRTTSLQDVVTFLPVQVQMSANWQDSPRTDWVPPPNTPSTAATNHQAGTVSSEQQINPAEYEQYFDSDEGSDDEQDHYEPESDSDAGRYPEDDPPRRFTVPESDLSDEAESAFNDDGYSPAYPSESPQSSPISPIETKDKEISKPMDKYAPADVLTGSHDPPSKFIGSYSPLPALPPGRWNFATGLAAEDLVEKAEEARRQYDPENKDDEIEDSDDRSSAAGSLDYSDEAEEDDDVDQAENDRFHQEYPHKTYDDQLPSGFSTTVAKPHITFTTNKVREPSPSDAAMAKPPPQLQTYPPPTPYTQGFAPAAVPDPRSIWPGPQQLMSMTYGPPPPPPPPFMYELPTVQPLQMAWHPPNRVLHPPLNISDPAHKRFDTPEGDVDAAEYSFPEDSEVESEFPASGQVCLNDDAPLNSRKRKAEALSDDHYDANNEVEFGAVPAPTSDPFNGFSDNNVAQSHVANGGVANQVVEEDTTAEVQLAEHSDLPNQSTESNDTPVGDSDNDYRLYLELSKKFGPISENEREPPSKRQKVAEDTALASLASLAEGTPPIPRATVGSTILRTIGTTAKWGAVLTAGATGAVLGLAALPPNYFA
ncbi:uncharacterized protein AB675_1305 [Cyphellophora attinorum]|uniref:FHA domain-containing protein n=1 Tax=Cyphellophora attinorum TaxID=1664694 RepID=A0A0N0NIR2_9EURO|nr:uncharacterized protein AB675_1305 [Phialophora attinorum]KPI35749.1 hypothetical protein AB675_1305 [Phialophora attinorum]